jgi:serine/threonine protein kinase
LKPQNVLLNDSGINGNAVICDLGTAKNMTPGALNFERTDNSHEQLHHPDTVPNMTTMTGTPMYMAPESFVSASYTNAVDVWSYGVLLVRLFTLKSPYPKNTTAGELMRCVASNELRPIDVERSVLPHSEIKDVIDGCLKFEPSERYTFVEIEKLLSSILGQLEDERKQSSGGGGGGGGDSGALLPQHQTMMSSNNVNMTLTLTRSIGHKPTNSTLMRVLSRKS